GQGDGNGAPAARRGEGAGRGQGRLHCRASRAAARAPLMNLMLAAEAAVADDAGLRVVHEDAAIIVIDKPSGLHSVPAKPPGPQDCAEARVKAIWPDALLVHRLDRDTSGLMVFARTRLAQRHLGWQFERRQVGKLY